MSHFPFSHLLSSPEVFYFPSHCCTWNLLFLIPAKGQNQVGEVGVLSCRTCMGGWDPREESPRRVLAGLVGGGRVCAKHCPPVESSFIYPRLARYPGRCYFGLPPALHTFLRSLFIALTGCPGPSCPCVLSFVHLLHPRVVVCRWGSKDARSGAA
jgi:hypothetical protein